MAVHGYPLKGAHVVVYNAMVQIFLHNERMSGWLKVDTLLAYIMAHQTLPELCQESLSVWVEVRQVPIVNTRLAEKDELLQNSQDCRGRV